MAAVGDGGAGKADQEEEGGSHHEGGSYHEIAREINLQRLVRGSSAAALLEAFFFPLIFWDEWRVGGQATSLRAPRAGDGSG